MLFYFLQLSETKQSKYLDGSSVVPFDLLKAVFFNRKENMATTSTVQKMAVEMVECFLVELRYSKKATPGYLASELKTVVNVKITILSSYKKWFEVGMLNKIF